MREGKNVALVTDAGTPGISDPGYSIVRRAIDAGESIPAIQVPPVSSWPSFSRGCRCTTALSRLSPRKSGQRRRFLEVDQDSPHTLIFYESPFRLVAFLEDALAVYGDRPAALANDLTKFYEQIERNTLSQLHKLVVDETKLKGEYIVIIAGPQNRNCLQRFAKCHKNHSRSSPFCDVE